MGEMVTVDILKSYEKFLKECLRRSETPPPFPPPHLLYAHNLDLISISISGLDGYS